MTSEKNFCILLEKEVKTQDVQGRWKTMLQDSVQVRNLCGMCETKRDYLVREYGEFGFVMEPRRWSRHKYAVYRG